MYKIAENRFKELYEKYSKKVNPLDIYAFYLNSVSENGFNLFNVPLVFRTNEMIMKAIETSNNPIHLMTRFSLDLDIHKHWQELYGQEGVKLTDEKYEEYITDLSSIIDLKYKRILYNPLFANKKLYTFIDFFHSVTLLYSGMDTFCYVLLYRGKSIPIRIKESEKKENYKLVYDIKTKVLNLIKITANEYKQLWDELSIILRNYYNKSILLSEYCWDKMPSEKTEVAILHDGEYYDTFKTIEEDGVVYDKSHSCLLSVPNDLVEFNIPEGITNISDSCFMGMTSLRRVKFPSTLESIPKAAFLDCISLEEVDLSLVNPWLTAIIVGSAAFCNCTSLKNIDMSKLELEKSAHITFAYCRSLKSIANIKLGSFKESQMNFFCCENLTELTNEGYYYGAFDLAYCRKLKNISLTTNFIPCGMLCGCEALEKVEFLEDSGICINCSDYSFIGCKSLKEINTKGKGLKIGKLAFAYCPSLETVIIDKKFKKISSISKSAFKGSIHVNIKWIGDSYDNQNDSCEYDDSEYKNFYEDDPTYERYAGTYAQEEMGYSDEDIDTIFDGEPDAYWNID